MGNAAGVGRNFLFLQGPHGPFFHQLGKMLCATGAGVTRVGFNAGDRAFWRDRGSYLAFRGPLSQWPAWLEHLIGERKISDIVLYGDTRPVHAHAVELARRLGLCVHVFEEGYLRPYWVSYERGGSNGNSRLMDMDVADMQGLLSRDAAQLPEAPDHWGDMREHVFYGALYHWFVLFRNRRYRNFRSHRAISLGREFSLHLNRLTLMPLHWAQRVRATAHLKRGGYPYNLVLLQLEHDASFQAHSPFTTMGEFLELVVGEFARGAPTHNHLVFKAHPLEDGRAPVQRDIARLAAQHQIRDRVHYIRGGKLAGLLAQARSAVTVNSTAAQQALWRGLPLKIFGAAVYAKPEFVSDQGLADFFADPAHPNVEKYRDFRRFLLETSQVSGGFYAARSRRQLLRKVVDMMLHDGDPYDVLQAKTAAAGQQLHLLKQVGG